MLTLGRDTFLDEERLYIHSLGVEAWISRHPRRDLEYGRDWQLWVRKRPGEVPRTGKSLTRLMIESRLRHWLFRRYRLHLFSLRFEDLGGIAPREEDKTGR
jgi:hypothetical protein